MFIVMIASECAPVAKVGGLADVVFGLSRELEIRGNDVEIILPKYDCMRYDQIYALQESFKDLWVPYYDQWVHCTVYFGFVHGRKCYFIENAKTAAALDPGCLIKLDGNFLEDIPHYQNDKGKIDGRIYHDQG